MTKFTSYKNTLDTFVKTHGGDTGAKDIARVLRLAGFNNMKDPKQPFLVTAEVNDVTTYSRQQILDTIPITAATQNDNQVNAPFELPNTIMTGERNDTLFKYGCSLRAKGASDDEIKINVAKVNRESVIEPLNNGELRALIQSVVKYPEGKLFHVSTEMGNAERFHADWRHIALYNADTKKWMIWNGIVWDQDYTNQILEKAKITAKNIMNDAKERKDENRDKAINWARQSQSLAKLKATTVLASSMMACRASQFDQIDMQLNLPNCIIDLDTGQPIQHKREYYHSLLASTPHDLGAQCPVFKGFLKTTFGGDQGLIDYVQRIMGYLLTGNTGEQCIFILLGDGRNGKSTLLNVIIEMLGDYHKRANADTFLTTNKSPIRSDLARLEGCRVVTGSEAGDNKFWDESLIKDISGGERVTARHLYANEGEFSPKFKLLIAVNSLPQIRGVDGGIWRRIKILPFDHIVAAKDVDHSLGDKLKQELPGILNFALEGLQEWHKHGISEPNAVAARMHAYRKEMDRVQAFIDEKCDTGEGLSIPAANLYQSYAQWAKDNGYHPLSANKLGSNFKAKKYQSKKARDDGQVKQVYFGISLIDDGFDNG